MNELKRIVEGIESAFADTSYPRAFLDAYDQMECLGSHSGREVFLVQRKADGATAVASCYARSVFPFHPDIRLLQSIRHPGLPRYYEQFQNDQMICIVREYIEGEPLSVYAREKLLSEAEIVGIAQRLCDILEALHTHDPMVIHRDIKPENIIVRPDGGIALIDFDISRAFKDSAESDTVFFGTKGYAPPEQYGFGQTDNRTDIYAFGVLLRWLVTGSTRANDKIAINPALQAIIDRCTAFSPDARYRDVREVRRALEGVKHRRRRVGARAVAAWVAAAALLLCAGFAVGRWTNWLRPVAQVEFAEPLIERAARLQLGKERGALTEGDLGQVTRLYIYGDEAFADPEPFYACTVDATDEGPIRTLDDLQKLPNLEEVHIIRQGYVDAAGLAGLSQLSTVELKHMRLSGVAPIADVPRLRHAVLFCAGLTDVTALEKCPWLETLDIGLNDIDSLAAVGCHPGVKSLGLMWLEMDDVADIAERFPKVEAVTLQHGHIGDLSGLKSLPKLQAVYALADQADALHALFDGTDVQINITEN